MRDETSTFLNEQKHELADCFSDPIWMCRLAYLADILSIINTLNLDLQGYKSNIFLIYEKNDRFKLKLKLISEQVKLKKYLLLPSFCDFVHEKNIIFIL
jgi:hypothetical protein